MKYLPKHFSINIQYKFDQKEHLRHFFHIFSEVHFVTFSRYRKKEDSASMHLSAAIPGG